MQYSRFLRNGYLTFASAAAIVTVLPIYGYYLPPIMIMWGIAWLLENNFRIERKMIHGNKAAILFFMFIIFYVWQISGLLYAESLSSGVERIVKRLSFLLFPLVLFYPGEKIKLQISVLLRLFVIFTLVYLLYCFGNAAYNSFSFQQGNLTFNPHPVEFDYESYFYGDRLSGKIHPTYLSMYVLLSIVLSLDFLITCRLRGWKCVLWIIIFLILLVSIYLLSSRAGILAGIIVIPLYLMIKFNRKFSKWLILAGTLFLIIFLVIFFRTNLRINYSIEELNGTSLTEMWQNDVRVTIWESALGVIERNLVLGVGTGDASEELKKEFLRSGYTSGYYDNLNAHNQFLETILENGIVGFVLFLGLIGYMLYMAVSEKNLVYGMYILMMILYFMFETVLNRLSGITFFALFSFMLVHYGRVAKT